MLTRRAAPRSGARIASIHQVGQGGPPALRLRNHALHWSATGLPKPQKEARGGRPDGCSGRPVSVANGLPAGVPSFWRYISRGRVRHQPSPGRHRKLLEAMYCGLPRAGAGPIGTPSLRRPKWRRNRWPLIHSPAHQREFNCHAPRCFQRIRPFQNAWRPFLGSSHNASTDRTPANLVVDPEREGYGVDLAPHTFRAGRQ